MKQLNKIIIGRGEVKGYTLTQVDKTDLGYIYEKKCNDTQKVSYEVFKHRESKRFDCVSYPSSKAFGIWAWDCKSLEKAKEKLYNFKIKKPT